MSVVIIKGIKNVHHRAHRNNKHSISERKEAWDEFKEKQAEKKKASLSYVI